nr:FliH/SctL family protein [Halieaceae bacterium]
SEELEALRAQAWEEGLAAGREAAAAEVREQLAGQLQQLQHMLDAIGQPYRSLDDDLLEELARLAGHIARQVLRRELKTDPEAIIGVVREAIGSLPEDRESARVYLNHEDVKLVNDLSTMASEQRNWELLSDPAVPRGDCLVVRGAALVDASLEERVRAAMLQVLSGDREGDHTP